MNKQPCPAQSPNCFVFWRTAGLKIRIVRRKPRADWEGQILNSYRVSGRDSLPYGIFAEHAGCGNGRPTAPASFSAILCHGKAPVAIHGTHLSIAPTAGGTKSSTASR